MRIEVRVSNMYSLPKMLMTDIIFKLVRMDLIRHVCVWVCVCGDIENVINKNIFLSVLMLA